MIIAKTAQAGDLKVGANLVSNLVACLQHQR